ncbi:MAG: HAD-IC family P-type ATPase, partial [Planctomycetota bacterium]
MNLSATTSAKQSRQPPMPAWHQMSKEDCLLEQGVDASNGLTSVEAADRLREVGRNVLIEGKGRNWLAILREQLCSALVGILLAAVIISLALGEYVDALAIITIVVLNTALGFYQDYRAEKALAALKRFEVSTVRVLRDGKWQALSAEELIPGDIVQLEAGNLVPADCRLLQAFSLRTQEAMLTGESADIEKVVKPLPGDDLSLGDRKNMVYKGTLLTYGHATGLVIATGMATELGKIAHSLHVVEHQTTPLQRRLGQLGRTLAIASLVIVAAVFAMGAMLGEDVRLMVMTALSLAVAIVPEGLPAVATVTLAIGAMRMFNLQALIRRLPAVETLGSVTVICSDKTGTLTENKMTVESLCVDDENIRLPDRSATDRVPAGATHLGVGLDEGTSAAAELLLMGAGLCSEAELRSSGDDASEPANLEALGEPTEVALVTAAARCGLSKSALLEEFPLVEELAFDSVRKRMTTIHRMEAGSRQTLLSSDAQAVAFMKGATDQVVNACSERLWHGQRQPLDDAVRLHIASLHDQLAAEGKRVLAVACRQLAKLPATFVAEEIEQGMTLLGLVAIADPARQEAADAVTRCQAAGIRPVMITGDHPLTALSIAEQVGIGHADATLSGSQLATLSDDELRQRVGNVSVYARVEPNDKLRIVEALQQIGEVVAMTGDGVNDAPALKKAHIGVAMGVTGADVSKEASDMVLLDDNFATIVNAVEQGRIVYDNIRKFVRYTMSSNAGEVVVMIVGPLMGMPLPLLPLQILWINLVTDGLPGLALAVEPAERDTMQRPPRQTKEPIIDRTMWINIAWVGL